MNLRKRYKLTVEDESSIVNIAQHSAPLFKWVLAAIITFLSAAAIALLIIIFSPLHSLLPGYLKDSERTATEEQHLRLDSLLEVYDNNALFLENIRNVLNPVPIKRDTTLSHIPNSPDSLIPTSPEEQRFMSMMREREKYSISVIAPLAAESLMFSPVNEESVVTEDSKGSTKAKILLARGATVSAIADGTVIAVSQSLRDGGGSAVIIQHHKGFLSRCSRLSNVIVEPGDVVFGGQIIAVPNPGNALRSQTITIEMWHNGESLMPYEYLGDSNSDVPRYPVVDVDTGRGR